MRPKTRNGDVARIAFDFHFKEMQFAFSLAPEGARLSSPKQGVFGVQTLSVFSYFLSLSLSLPHSTFRFPQLIIGGYWMRESARDRLSTCENVVKGLGRSTLEGAVVSDILLMSEFPRQHF